MDKGIKKQIRRRKKIKRCNK